MATFLQNPSFLNTIPSNSRHSSFSFCLNFSNTCSILQNSCRQSRFLPLKSSPNVKLLKLRIQLRLWSQGFRKVEARASEGQENTTAQGRSFLSFEEAGLVEMSGLSAHERFLCRLTISSLNLLRVIAEQEGCEIEELNAGRVCDWFLKDKLKREQDIGSAILQWEDDADDFQF